MGLDLRDRYLVVATNFEDGPADFENTALGMIQVFGPDREPLPIVVATGDATWIRPRDFRTYGLEFDSGYGTRRFCLDGVCGPEAEGTTPEESRNSSWHEHRAELGQGAGGGFIAFARGKNDYLPAAPCEFYPEVQRLWRWRVNRMLEKGVDGVVLRVSAHGTFTDEPFEYVEDIERIWRDPRFHGFDLYEFFHLARATSDGSRLLPVENRISHIRRKTRELGIVEA